MLRTIIVDDEPIIRSDIELLLQACPDIAVVGACGSVKEAVLLIQTLKPDLLLLDIQLTDGNSFQILNALPELDCAVIFITAYDQHAIRAIRIGALDYLLKPVVDDELYEALDKVRKRRGTNLMLQAQEAQKYLNQKEAAAGKTIVLSSQKTVQVVAHKDIIYCEGDGNYTTFHLTGNQKIMVTKPLKEYDDLLPQPQFIRTHQSFLVNLKFVEHYNRDGFLRLLNAKEIPVSVRRKDMVLSFLNSHAS